MTDSSATGEGMYAEIQVEICYPAADRRTGFNPGVMCPDTGSPH